MKTGSDIRNPYKECFKQTGVPEYYKCLDLIGALEFFNSEHTKEDMHAEMNTHWQMCNFTIMD